MDSTADRERKGERQNEKVSPRRQETLGQNA